MCGEVAAGDNEPVGVDSPAVEYGTAQPALNKFVYIIRSILQLCIKVDGHTAHMMEN
jgi:hypothetical protein